MNKLIVYCGLNGVEAIKNRETKKTVYFGKKSKLGKVKTYPKKGI